jgi:ATP-dependent RNA helicase SUPV3L1/SUV3
VMVASDAIGMGLNLNIRRVIFHTTVSWDPAIQGVVKIEPSKLKQIAGRAGRKGTEFEAGLVCTRARAQLADVEAALSLPLEDMTESHAGLLPTFEQARPVCRISGGPSAKRW